MRPASTAGCSGSRMASRNLAATPGYASGSRNKARTSGRVNTWYCHTVTTKTATAAIMPAAFGTYPTFCPNNVKSRGSDEFRKISAPTGATTSAIQVNTKAHVRQVGFNRRSPAPIKSSRKPKLRLSRPCRSDTMISINDAIPPRMKRPATTFSEVGMDCES